ncbi:MAG: UDP-2,4-diacetamido-2,4,6-trideoxy-beta-L-altropyranose hydrolase [Desulfotomaculales bacterium]
MKNKVNNNCSHNYSPRVIFRVDSSETIGSGHLMRCLTLADKLRKKDVHVSFVCRQIRGNLCNFAEQKGYRVHRLTNSDAFWLSDAEKTIEIILKKERKVDWLIVDHYGLDVRWEKKLRPFVNKIMVIDDLANRPHDCDVLLDQNHYENLENRYQGLVPEQCCKLLGPRYALLRPEFHAERKKIKERDGCVRRILIFFGGSDPTNETTKALEAVRLLKRPNLSVDVVVGKMNPFKKQIEQLCKTLPNAVFYCQTDNMARLMAKADLALGAGGTSTWERCFLGLPSIILVLAENQLAVAEAVGKAGAAWNLGWNTSVTVEGLAETIEKALNNKKMVKEMADSAFRLMGGLSSENTILNLIAGRKNATT